MITIFTLFLVFVEKPRYDDTTTVEQYQNEEDCKKTAEDLNELAGSKQYRWECRQTIKQEEPEGIIKL